MKVSLAPLLAVLALPAAAFAQVTITSPAASSTSISAVTIAASAVESGSWHLEVWDNGNKLGNVFAPSVNAVYVLPNGPHTLTVNAVSSTGTVLSSASTNYTIAESCTTSQGTSLCNMEQLPVDTMQLETEQKSCTLTSPNTGVPQEADWVANACQDGIQGSGGSYPTSVAITPVTESGTIPDVGNTTLNGQSLHLSEDQGSSGLSNVLFKADRPFFP